MEKPKPKEREPILDFFDMLRYIEGKYKINTRDYNGRGRNHLNGMKAICKEMNIPWSDMGDINKMRKVRDEFDKRYPRQDYVDYLKDDSEFHNGCEMVICLGDFLYPPQEGEEREYDTPDWVEQIERLIFIEFKEYLDEEGCLLTWVWW